MSEEKITPELVNEMACNTICFQKNPTNTWVDIKKLDPNSKQYHENGWEYKSPALIVLYESGRIVYENQLFYMNEKTRNTLLQTLKNQEKAAKRKELGQMIRYTLAATATIIGVVVIVHVISKAVQSEQKEQPKTEKVQGVKASVLNPKDTIVAAQKEIQR